jgi:hypothetical protein
VTEPSAGSGVSSPKGEGESGSAGPTRPVSQPIETPTTMATPTWTSLNSDPTSPEGANRSPGMAD